METNLLKAICNIKNLSIFEMSSDLDMDANRITQQGKALEVFVKDAFSNSFDKTNNEKKNIYHPQYFSYLGNKNNPPDAMLKNGDAIEFKKRKDYGAIPLNSSYPKNKLFAHDTRISRHCKECEECEEMLLHKVNELLMDDFSAKIHFFCVTGKFAIIFFHFLRNICNFAFHNKPSIKNTTS